MTIHFRYAQTWWPKLMWKIWTIPNRLKPSNWLKLYLNCDLPKIKWRTWANNVVCLVFHESELCSRINSELNVVRQDLIIMWTDVATHVVALPTKPYNIDHKYWLWSHVPYLLHVHQLSRNLKLVVFLMFPGVYGSTSTSLCKNVLHKNASIYMYYYSMRTMTHTQTHTETGTCTQQWVV